MSAFLIILFDNVMLISLNMMLQRYGGDNSDMLLTCNTIVQSFELLITMPLGGLTMGDTDHFRLQFRRTPSGENPSRAAVHLRHRGQLLRPHDARRADHPRIFLQAFSPKNPNTLP